MGSVAYFHHGYLLTGDAEAAFKKAVSMAAEFLAVDEKDVLSHPDLSVFKKNLFTVDEARQVRENSSRKPFGGKARVFLIQADFFNKESMNALLKTIEEPACPVGGPSSGYFLIVTSSPENVLLTLRSRMVHFKFPLKEISGDSRDFMNKFLGAQYEKRIEMAKEYLEDKERAMNFLNILEEVLHGRLREKFSSKDVIFALEETAKQRRRMFIKGASFKMILEHLCLVLPVI